MTRIRPRLSNLFRLPAVRTAQLAMSAVLCLSLTACATLEPQTDSRPGAAASIGDGGAPRTPPQPVYSANAPQLQTRLAAPATQNGAVALAAHTEPAAQQKPVAPAVYQAPTGPNAAPAVAHALHNHDPNQRNTVQQVDWSQCPTCWPVASDGPNAFSLEHDAEMARRYRDEYICDGGDIPLAVQLDKRMKANGLNIEDTVAHFVTEDGKIVVEPSTRTCIYAPRFAAVRQVHSLAVNEHSSTTGATGYVATPTLSRNNDAPIDLHQPLELAVSAGAEKLHENSERNRAVPSIGVTQLLELDRELLPFENFNFIRQGTFANSDKVRLAKSAQNAIAWSGDSRAQAILDETPAVVAAAATGLDGLYEYKTPKGKPRLRVVKLADRDNAHPGDEVRFTLRFDNIGDQAIKQVVLLDNLSGRLEYVEDSAECTVPAKFSSELNDAESLMLRWELEEPLPVGKGGVIRFKCKVR